MARAGANRSDRILHVGCGNSEVIKAMWDDGFQDVVHLDISEVVIQNVSSQLSFVNHTFAVGDMTSLNFEDASFDVVLDKGAIDALFTGGLRLAKNGIREIARVLRPVTGRYVMTSMSEPGRRWRTQERRLMRKSAVNCLEKLSEIFFWGGYQKSNHSDTPLVIIINLETVVVLHSHAQVN